MNNLVDNLHAFKHLNRPCRETTYLNHLNSPGCVRIYTIPRDIWGADGHTGPNLAHYGATLTSAFTAPWAGVANPG